MTLGNGMADPALIVDVVGLKEVMGSAIWSSGAPPSWHRRYPSQVIPTATISPLSASTVHHWGMAIGIQV
jgi:hypothetical protein